MTTNRVSRPFVALLALLLALVGANSAANAEGEAGLVVDFGNGEIVSYCVVFGGADISGQQMMAQVGLSVNQFSGLVCSIDGTGCQHSGSFDSCTCECKAGSSSCTYWSLFNQRYGGSWIYSAAGFQLSRAKDGDIQAWKWGAGGANSAPPPGTISFEQICGHSPRGGQAEPTATLVPPTATLPPPTSAPTSPPATTSIPATTAPGATGTTAPGTTPLVTITAAASAAATSSVAAGAPATTPGTSEATGTIDPAGTSVAPGSPASGGSPAPAVASPSFAPRQTAVVAANEDSSGSNATNLVAFGAITAVLVAAIGVAVVRGRKS